MRAMGSVDPINDRRSGSAAQEPTALQLDPRLGLTAPLPIKVFPFISQIETWPLLVFWKRMSEWPSPLKSPVPIAF